MSFSFLSSQKPKTTKGKTVAITGATGLIGPALTASLKEKGYNVIKISTKKSKADDTITWNPSKGELDGSALEGVDAIVNLAGENVASGEGLLAILGRWSDSKKSKIINSRIDSTKLLVNTMSTLKKKPKTLISASGIGYYGYKDFSKVFDETSPQGDGFLAEVVSSWEAEAKKAPRGVRVVTPRFASVLSPAGGVVGKLLPIFLTGTGGTIGSGSQPFPWVSLNDVVKAIIFILESSLSGPVNVCSPDSVSTTNTDLTKAIGSAINRPTFIPIPEPIVKLIFGQFGEELLLGGQKADAKKLISAGFKFENTNLSTAMPSILKK